MKSPVVPSTFTLFDEVVGVPSPLIHTKPRSVMAAPLSVRTLPERVALLKVMSDEPTVFTTGVEARVLNSTTSL